jgi:hypothetical protein
MYRLGIVNDQTGQWDAYLLEGTLFRNDLVWKKQDELRGENGERASYEDIYKALTPAERISVRDFVLGVKQFPSPGDATATKGDADQPLTED